MKKLYILFFFFSFHALSQDLNMQDGTFNRCAPDFFYDSGGPGGPYSSNENIVTTICPENTGEFMIINFINFSTQLNVDVLTVYDGDSTSAPVIGSYSGVAGPGNIISSALNMTGCITFEFVTDGTGTTTGWEAELLCTVPCQTILPSIDSTTPEANGGGVILINVGDQVDFVGSATFSDDGTGATYEWDFDDTNTATGTNVSNIFTAPGSYDVTLTVTDTNPLGCSTSREINVFVLGPNIVVDQTTFTVEELVQDVLIDSPCAQVSNITWSTGTNFNDDNGIGYFANDGSVFPFTDGLLMTSGDASRARGPNNNALSEGGFGWPGDAELDAEVGINSNNATFIQFDFVPLADSISFDFLMASEEYNGSTGGTFECTFSDAFAFLLTDALGNTTNLAVLPGTTTPILVTNIHPANPGCPAINEQFFGGYTGNNLPPMSFDGRTTVFTAQSPVIPGDNYTIKLVIADASDASLDSGVFIEAGSFNLGGDLGDDITIAAGNAECGGELITLDTQAPNANHVWYLDGVVIVGETSSTLELSEPGIYSVDVIFSGSCQASDSVLVEFKPNAVANTPPDLSICSFSGTGDFMLTDNDDDVLGAQDPNDYIISYHLTEQDAIDNVNPLASPYTNISNPQTIHVRIAENTQECFDLTSFDLVFTDLTINNAVTPIDECDDNNDGFAMFTLTDRNLEVIGALDASTVSVSYHVSQADADNNVNPLSIPFTNTVINNQTVFVRVEANTDPGCYNTTTLDIRVNPVPVPVIPTSFEVCDDDNDGFAMFDLTLKDAEILGGQTGITVTYHETQTEADTGVNAQSSPYSNISANSQTLFVRLEDDISGCADTVELLLVVNPTPSVGTISNYELCDINMPGDGIETFDLSTRDLEAINGQTGVTVSYHETQADAEAGINALPNLYNNTSNPQTIYANITNTTSNCTNVGSFDIIVNPLPALVPPTPLEVCDDGTPDGITSIDLTLKNVEITGNNPNYSVSYHETQADADNTVNPLPIPYTNLFNGQTVYVNVQDINTGCSDTTTLVLTVEQAPIANTPTPLTYCDPDSDGFGVFDLISKDLEVTGGDPNLSVSYHETMADADNDVNPLASPYNNIVEDMQTIYVRVESASIATDCATIVELILMVNPTPQLGSGPSALEICDDISADGFGQFDLTSKEGEILQNLADPSQYTVTYYETQVNADAPMNAIANPANYTNTTAFNQIIWIRVEDVDPNTACYKLTTLELIVNALPVLVQPTPLELCDDNNPGDEMESFMLEDATDEILNGQTGISLTYYTTQLDADNGTNPITSPYTNMVNPQTIFVRATNDATGCFVSTTASILLRVNPIPSPTAPTDLEECDEDNDGFASFDLETRTLEIIGGELDTAVTYHETQEDANMGDNALTSPYTNIVMDVQTIYIRLTNTITGCYNASETLTIRVLESPEVPVAIEDYVLCDTNADGITQFDLTTKDAEIIGTQSDVTLTYHVTQADAETGNNPIANVGNYTNTSNPQTIYVHLVSNTNGCIDTGTFDLRVELPPVALQPTPLQLCDDEIADEITVFDLTVKDNEITGGQASWSVSYYESQADADAGTNAVNAEAYTNMSIAGAPANPQTLYVVVTDTDTGCTDQVTLTIRVLPNPTPTEVLPELILCDDINPGDMEEVFDLTTNELLLLNGETGVTPTYHESQEDAEDGINAIADPTMYTNTSTPQVIYVRVTNDITGCYTIVNFTLIVNPLPDVVAVTDFIACELNNDGFYDFDLGMKDDEVLNGQDPGLFTVTYHVSQQDADDLVNALVSPYTNISNPQQIFVAITNNTTGCSISTPSFNVEVQEAAEANSDMEAIVFEICDDQMDDDNDPTNNSAQFELTLQNDAILDGQDPANYIVSYYASEVDAELAVNPLPLLYENLVNPQVIWARVDNDTPDGAGMDTSICYAVAPLTLQVNPLPVFDLDDSYILCVGTNGSEVLNAPVLNTGLTAPTYSFIWFFNGVEIPGETLGSYMPTEGGTYSVTVTDVSASANTMCQSSDSTEVIESAPPVVTAIVTTDAFADTHVIEVSVNGPGEYEYSLDDGPWQDEPIFVDVSLGEHVVTARDKNGCGEASDDVIVMDYPVFFTPNGDGYHDTWNISAINNQPNAKIYIFDRYGKLLKQLSPTGAGWNGTYNGNPMPTSDYWFVVEYNEPNTGDRKEFKAHFTLKR